MTADIKIRTAKKEDVDDIYRVFLHLKKAEDSAAKKISSDWKNYRTERPDFEKSVKKDIKSKIADRKIRYTVAVSDREIIGYAIGKTTSIKDAKNNYFLPVKTGHLRAIAVKDNYQGRKIGSALHKDMLIWFSKKGCVSVSLDAFVTNPSVNIYKKWGYRKTIISMNRPL